MKTIQFISKNKKNYKTFECSTFNNLKALDSFELNIFDLNDPGVWTNDNGSTYEVNSTKDFNDINQMISKSNKCKVLLLFPQNYYFEYERYEVYSDYMKSIQLKDNIPGMLYVINRLLTEQLSNVIFENNETTIDNTIFESSFCICSKSATKIISADKTEKNVFCRINNVFVSFLDLKTEEDVVTVLKAAHLISIDHENIPSWLEDYKFYNEDDLKKENKDADKAIKTLESKIKENNLKIKDCLYYKRVLIETGDALVEIVFKILNKLLNVNPESFKDMKKEDFLFKINDNFTIIGEIKGVTSNVKNNFISQLQHNYDMYIDELKETKGIIKKILVVNHQRDKAIKDRLKINEDQIKYAKMNDVLIVETTTLLKLYELFLNKKIEQPEIINYLLNKTGVLEIN